MSSLQPPSMVDDPVVIVNGLHKVFGSKDNRVHAVDDITIGIQRRSMTTIMGPSGSGKSTFMHCVAGLDSVTKGTIDIDDVRITDMSQRELTKMRRENIGFVFQSFNLIPTLTAQENMTLPVSIASKKVNKELFDAVVEAFDLRDRLDHKPSELSGGQQQRVACARAIIQQPTVLFADEPTGNLDSHSTQQVLSYLRRAVDDFGQTVVMVTHEPDAAAWADKVLFLSDGRLVAELNDPNRQSILDALGDLDTHAEQLSADASPQQPGRHVDTTVDVDDV